MCWPSCLRCLSLLNPCAGGPVLRVHRVEGADGYARESCSLGTHSCKQLWTLLPNTPLHHTSASLFCLWWATTYTGARKRWDSRRGKGGSRTEVRMGGQRGTEGRKEARSWATNRTAIIKPLPSPPQCMGRTLSQPSFPACILPSHHDVCAAKHGYAQPQQPIIPHAFAASSTCLAWPMAHSFRALGPAASPAKGSQPPT